jgi:acyl carrier protein
LARATGEPKAEVEMLNLVAQATLNSIIKQSSEMRDEEAIYFISQHEASAIRPAREAATLARKMGDKQMTGIATYSVAQCHAVAGRSPAAVNAAMEARDLFRQTWDRQGEAMSVLMLAESLVLDGDMEQGRELATESQKLFDALDDHDGSDKAAKTLRQIDEIAGFTPAAKTSGKVPSPAAADPAAQAASSKAVVAKLGLSPEKAKEMARKVALDAIGGEEDEITVDDGLMDIGLDSLAAIAFRESLCQAAGINLPSTLVFDYPTLSAVADFLVDASME